MHIDQILQRNKKKIEAKGKCREKKSEGEKRVIVNKNGE